MLKIFYFLSKYANILTIYQKILKEYSILMNFILFFVLQLLKSLEMLS